MNLKKLYLFSTPKAPTIFLMVSNRKMILLSLETGTRTFCELFALVTVAKKEKV